MGYQASWFSGLSELRIVASEYYFIVRIISGFFITLALALILPVLGLVVYDIILWIWRLCSSRPSPVGAVRAGQDLAVDNRKPATNGDITNPKGSPPMNETGRPL